MNRLFKLFAIFCLFTLSMQVATAARNNSNPYQERHYFGLIYGEADGGPELGTSTATGFILSARNNKAALEYVMIRSNDGVISATNGTWETTTQGIYYAIQGQGQSYMKLKIGRITQETVQDPLGDGNLAVVDQYYNSYGVGFGYHVTNDTLVEFEFTQMGENISLLSLSFLF